jgi:transposase
MLMRRYELTDDQWEMIAELFPAEEPRQGRPWRPHRQVFNGILWVLFSGAAWRDLPERYGPWKTVYGRFNRWQKDGTIEKVLKRLQLKMDEEGLLDYSTWMVDSTVSRAHKSASGARKKKPNQNR